MEHSAAGRLVSVLVAPERTFRSIGARPTWALALLGLVLVSLLVTAAIMPKVDIGEEVRQKIAERGQEVPEEQLDRIVAFSERFKWINALGSVLLVQPLGYLLVAAIFLGLMRLLDGEIGYRASLAVTLHGFLPWALAGLLSLPVALSRGQVSLEEVQGGGLLLSNLGFLAPDGSAFLASLLGSVDVFSLWTVALLAIGYRVVAKVTSAAAWGSVVTLWLVWVLGKAGLTAAF